MKGKLIAEGAVGKVYDNEDDTVTKVMTDDREYKLAQQLLGVRFKYVANYISASTKFCKYLVIKEKISDSTYKVNDFTRLAEHWDEALLHSHELFEYLNQYLKEGIKPLKTYRVTDKFITYLYTIPDRGEALFNQRLFMELCELVQELKNLNIYNIDWNPENFGSKRDHIALFELGGAKIKKSK
jgi:hypothetical protein